MTDQARAPQPRRMALGGLHASLALLATILAAGHGCKDRLAAQAPAGAAPGGQPAASGPSFSSPRPLDVLAGRVPLVASGGSVQVLVDGQPGPALAGGKGWLDTNTLTDGIHRLQLVSGGRPTPELLVIVLNQGSEVFFKNGSSGVIRAPKALQGECESQHLRYHWDMTSGVKQVLAVLTWSGASGLDLELALGTGTCPHSGARLALASGKQSPVVVKYEPGGDLPAEQWFAHVRPLNQTPGAEVPFQVRAFLLR